MHVLAQLKVADEWTCALQQIMKCLGLSYSGLTWKMRIKAAANSFFFFFFTVRELNPLQLKKTWIHRRTGKKLSSVWQHVHCKTLSYKWLQDKRVHHFYCPLETSSSIVIRAACSVLWMFVATCCQIDNFSFVCRCFLSLCMCFLELQSLSSFLLLALSHFTSSRRRWFKGLSV